MKKRSILEKQRDRDGASAFRYLSVCSGIEGATVAWHPLGWRPAGFSEVDPFCRAVIQQRLGALPVDLDHRWEAGQNHTPLFGDFTQIEAHHVGPVDLLVGGTPCQAFSVAGKRLGLDDPRGNLTIEFFRLAERIRARWLVWENVPGVLSNWSGEPDDEAAARWDETSDFAAILALFSECGYRGGWRVLDAQYVRVDGFGGAVPQRRRRVFLVGHLGDDARALAVLFDPESLRGIDPPRRKAGQGAPVASGSDPEGDRGAGRHGGPESGLIAGTVSSKWAKGTGGPAGDECQNLVAHSLRGEAHDASEDGTGRGTPLVAVPVADTLGVGANQMTGTATEMVAVAYRSSPNKGVYETGDRVDALTTGTDPNSHPVAIPSIDGWAVRRLTPRECERLQGFPDDWTLIERRGKPAADGPRYRAIGNSMAVNVMRWIGARIALVEEAVRAAGIQREAA